ncbi:MAG: IS1634 family transposase [bacterium]|nr:IS1634 family transposase [bacterium]
MYLRTTRRKNRDGSEVVYYQLAHNDWNAEARRSETQIVHNFGRADELDRDALVRLCRSIGRVCGVEVRDPLSDEQEEGDDPVLAPGVRQIVTRPLGVVWVVEALWTRLGIGRLITGFAVEANTKAVYERALLAMTANRLGAEPTSKLGVQERWAREVYLPSCWSLTSDEMYEAMDLLHANQARFEEAVFFETANLFNLVVDLVFYDTTTASFSIDYADEDGEDGPGLRKLGHSKEGTWTEQVVIALAVTRDGLPVRSWVFPGNTSDVTTIQRVREDLRGWKLGRALFVGDSGFNSEDNRIELARACGRYVLACRAASVAEIKREVLARPGRYKKLADNLHVKEVVVGEGEKRRRYVICYNPSQAERQSAHRDQVVAELEAELASHPDPDAQAKWAVELRASGRYGRYLVTDKAGRLAIGRSAIREASRYDGKWVLITNDDTLLPGDAADAYKSLLVIERCFRSLKRAQIQMAPMYHWLRRRIETHVKICVLALLIERIVERETGMPWARVRHALERLQATEYEKPAAGRFFVANELPREVATILAALKIKPPKRLLAAEPLPAPTPGA